MMAMRTVLCGVAVGATGLLVLVGQGGVFAAEGANAVSVAMASQRVSSAAETIAALGAKAAAATSAPAAEAAATVPEPVAATQEPRSTAALPMLPSSEAKLGAPQIAPLAAVVPTPQLKPEITGSTVRRPAATARLVEQSETRRTAAAARTRSLRPVTVASEEAAERRPRRVLTTPLPAIIGAYR